MDSDQDILDMSWVDETTRIVDMDRNYEPEHMQQIAAHFIYMNVNNYIEKTKTEYIKLDAPSSEGASVRIITKDTLLKIIQQNQTKTHNSKYYLQDILWYNVELKPENIQNSIYNENSVELFKQYFKIVQLMQIDDIVLQPSIFIFHSLQCMYFIFQEKEMELSTHKIKSIMKPTYSHTKKVRMDLKTPRKSRKTTPQN